ncbi:hypothetical protein FA95DRAFT_1562874 [Auriscalpium vulgare]|uniref:Uncharacterized protein n=1 Tax=Auriscalpium vulgare TaxID=40419 RepID=A0ACB8RI29_9AGAM|nr:hypothetical protein FA95DRAFT_1562874 [Auriscalpium vulgare]
MSIVVLTPQQTENTLNVGVLGGVLSAPGASAHLALAALSAGAQDLRAPQLYADPARPLFVSAQNGAEPALVCVDWVHNARIGTLVPLPCTPGAGPVGWPVWFAHEGAAEPGVKVFDMLEGDCRIVGAEETISAPSACFQICIAWPGYHEYKYSRRTPTRQENISVDDLLWIIAEDVLEFITKCAVRDVNSPVQTPQRLVIDQANGVCPGDVTIVGALNLTHGSWYPILRVAPRPVSDRARNPVMKIVSYVSLVQI